MQSLQNLHFRIVVFVMLVTFAACNSGKGPAPTDDTTVVKKDTTAVIETDTTAEVAAKYHGVDVSKYNGNAVEEIDAADSLYFIICKATEGVTLVDPSLRSNWKLIRDKKMILGAYHFYHTDDDPTAQAQFYCSTVDAQGKLDITPIVDIEQGSLTPNQATNTNQLQSNLLIYLNVIEKHYKRIPMIYTGEAFAQQFLNNPVFAKYPLWLAEYSGKAKPILPDTWKATGYKIWQKRANFDINSTPTDYDVYFGKLSEL